MQASTPAQLSSSAQSESNQALIMTSGPLKQAAESARSRTSEIMKSDTVARISKFIHTPYMVAALPFINGGLSGMVATSVVQPVDMVKVRIQLAGEGTASGPKPSPIAVARQIVASGKFTDLYTGLSAGLLRQAVYTTARLGFFDTFMGRLGARAKADGRTVGFKERATAGLTAGGLAAMIGNPADLALIRMQSDGLKPLAERKNYKSVIDALSSIAKSEGVGALWAGAAPTVARAMALNFGQLAFFSEAKAQLKQNTDLSPRIQTLTASATAGFFASFFSLPFDFVKTRLQKQQKGPDGKLPYKGMADCFTKVAKQEGLLRFYRGFGTYYVRIAPHAMVTLIVADYLGWLTKWRREELQLELPIPASSHNLTDKVVCGPQQSGLFEHVEMVGRKRRSNAGGGRENSNAVAAPSRGGSTIYREMLAEAGIEGSVSRDSVSGEPPMKRRRAGRQGPGQEQQAAGEATAAARESSDDDDEDEDAEFLDVPLPPAQVQTIELDSEDDSEEDEDGMVFEDVDFSTALDKSKDAASSAAEPRAQELELNLTAQQAANATAKRIVDRRKPITKEERDRRLDVHKMHLLCLLSHVARRNHWCNDSLVQDALRPHLSDKTADYLTPGAHLPQFGQTESLKTGLQQAADVWRAKFEVTERGLRRARWAEDAAQLAQYQLPDHLETCTDRQDFRHAATTLQGSRDVGAQLYCALLRSVGIKARLVCSLQPLAFGNGAPTLPKVTPAKTPTKTQRAEAVLSQIAQYKEMAATATTTSPTASTARRRLGHPSAASHNFEPKPSPSPRKTQKSFATPVRLRESAYPVYWVEVLDTGHQKWQPADPVVTHTFWKPKSMEPPITDKENCMSYVVAFDEDGTARDVTVRYAKAYAAKTRRIRVDGTDGNDWWRTATRPFKRRRRTDLDQIEDSELAGVESREPMPRNVQDFKNHPVFALPRHLRRHEVLVPTAMPSGTVSSGNKGPLEKIYRRRDVRVARSADKWFRMGREVRPNEIPAKWLPKIKRTKPRNGRFDDDRRAEEDAQDAAGVPIYTHDQTELYEPDPVRNGRVPKNKFGNVEVYVPSMVPRGGTHIAHALAAHAAKLVGVDYAPALTGFSFAGRQGTAVLTGVVVAAEYGAAVEAVLAGLEDAEQEREEAMRALAALKLWRRLLMGLRIRQRIWSGVDEAETRAAEEEVDRVPEEADAVEEEGEEGEEGESDDTEEFDMVVDGDDAEEYGGGFLVD